MDRRRQERKRRVRMEIFARDDYTCGECGWRPEVPPGWDGSTSLTDGQRQLTIDHIIEKALGGPSTRDNFATLCSECNIQKSVHIGQLIRKAQDRGMSLEEARKYTAIRLGYAA